MLFKNPGYRFLLVWILWSGLVEAEPLLSGIAIHQELGREQFFGALYSDVLSNDPELLLNNQIGKRMELKILASEGMTTRRFSRMWIEGMAINNPTDLLIAQAENMVQFDNLFRGRLETNDHVIFSLTPGKGVDISVNGILLGNVVDDRFFNVLLSSWIGKIPLSSVYRDDLLKMGVIDENIRQRYLHFEPRLSRIAIVKDWHVEVDPETLTIETPVVASIPALNDTLQQSRSGSADKPPVATAKKPAAPIIEAPLMDASIMDASIMDASIMEGPVIQNPTIQASAIQATGIKTPAIKTPAIKVPIISDTKRVAEQNPQVAMATEKSEGSTQLTAEVLLARQFYISAALNSIYANVNYPRRAQELQQMGSVKFALVVDGKGNIKDLQPVEESAYRLLNKAAESAVKTSAPFPPLPGIIADTDLEFFVPIRFSISST